MLKGHGSKHNPNAEQDQLYLARINLLQELQDARESLEDVYLPAEDEENGKWLPNAKC